MKRTTHPSLHRLTLLAALLFQAQLLFSQGWARNYDFNTYGQYRLAAVLPTADGGFAAAGRFPGDLTGAAFLLKVNHFGDSLWLKTYDIVSVVGGCAHLPDGGFALVGKKNDLVFLLKTDSLGNVLWQQNLDASVKAGLAVAADSLGNLFVAGDRLAHPYLAKWDADGSLIWEKTFDQFAAPSHAGGDAKRGFAFGKFDFNYPYPLSFLRIAPEGNEIWQSTFSLLHANIYLADVEPGTDGGLAMAGSFFVSQTDSQVAFALQADSTGTLISQGGFFGGSDDYAFATSVVEIPGGFALLWQYSTLFQPAKYFLRGVPGAGELTPPFGLSILNTHPGGFIFAGSWEYGMGLMKTDKYGKLDFSNAVIGNLRHDENANCTPDPAEPPLKDWQVRLSDLAGNVLKSTTTDLAGNFALQADTGNYLVQALPPDADWAACLGSVSVQFSQFFDTAAVQLLFQTSQLEPTAESEAVQGVDFEVFPNPASARIWLQFEVAEAGEVSVFITNAQGVLVETILEKTWLAAGKHLMEANAAAWSAGVYFFHFVGEGGQRMQQAVLRQ